ncbi:MAG: hypothetical protein V4691_09210 [Pseudomonadota bacterium]
MNLREKFNSFRNVFAAEVLRHPLYYFTLLAVALIWFGQIGAAHRVLFDGLLRDTDDAMRLVEIRDFLAGQSWFDLTQHRLDPPHGVLMHWSRLIDAPVAGLILLFKIFTSQEAAERIARLVWPALLQAGFFASLLVLTRQLVGRVALFPAAILIGFSWILATQFEPGRLDHHSAQMLLSVLVLVFINASATNPRIAFFAGLSGAVMLAIGFEGLAVMALAGLYVFLLWIFAKENAAARFLHFGLGLTFSTVLIYVLTVPSQLYLQIFCDAQSFLSFAVMCVSGIIAIALSSSGRFLDTPSKRIIGAIAFGAIACCLLYQPASQCFGGPFSAVPQDLKTSWLDRVNENIGLFEHLKGNFWAYLPFAAPIILGLFCLIAAAYFQTGWPWILLTALAALHVVLTFEHLRVVSYASMFAIPGIAWCIVRLREKSQVMMAVAYITAIPAFWAIIGNAMGDTPPPAANTCNTPKNYTALTELPASTILAPGDMGPHLLAFTQHSVFGAPYHRNVDGIRFTFKALFSKYSEVVPKLREKKPAYIVLCKDLGELRGIQKEAPDSLAARLLRNEKLKGLKKVDLKTELQVWKVDYASLPAR